MCTLNQRGKILVIDDDPANGRILLDYLERAGHEVSVALSGGSALQLLEHLRPDLILLDILMPGIDGFETCRRLKRNSATRPIPVIFMTALTGTVDKVKGFDLGGVDYITKPLQYQEVLARVETHLTIKKLQEQLRNQMRQFEAQNTLLEEKNAQLEEEIIERKYAEASLKDTLHQIELAKQEWESTADSLSSLICLIDEKGCILRTNRTIERWKLGEVHSVKGQDLHALLHPQCSDDACYFSVFLHRALEAVTHNQTTEYEAVDPVLQRDFNLQVRLISPLELQSSPSSSSFAVCTITDITQRKEFERALHQRTRQLRLLNQLSDLLQKCRSQEETYRVVIKICAQLFPTASGSLCVMNEQQTLLQEISSWGNPPVELRTFGVDDPWIFDHHQIHLIDHPDIERSYVYTGYTPDRSCLCAPVSASGELLAILSLDLSTCQEEDALNHSSLRQLESCRIVLTAVVEHYALALINLRLREKLRKESILDPLTGLYNRRYMETALRRETLRAQRHQHSMGCMMIDVDRFKLLNDTYGHEAGDRVLRELGALLQRYIRGEDIACRYGGEEFLLILPEASLESTRQRAEEIRLMAKSLRIRYQQHTLQLTISLGVAAVPEHGISPQELVNAADAALYQAKNQGRDQVVTASS